MSLKYASGQWIIHIRFTRVGAPHRTALDISRQQNDLRHPHKPPYHDIRKPQPFVGTFLARHLRTLEAALARRCLARQVTIYCSVSRNLKLRRHYYFELSLSIIHMLMRTTSA